MSNVLFFPVGAEGLRIEFDRQCSTERRHDPLTIMDGANRVVSVRSGDETETLYAVVINTIYAKRIKNSCSCLICVFEVESGLIGPVS